jgi:BirA family transcriptional regulator, biotin operon repressor / biotin---[acetyl-CoA-carboxylase] ligase
VLLNGGKVAGILLESAGRKAGWSHLAVGIGVNLIATPPPGGTRRCRRCRCWAKPALRIAPEALLTTLAPAFATLNPLQTQGFAPIRAAWLAHAARLGETITARTGTPRATASSTPTIHRRAGAAHPARGAETIPAADLYF